MDIIRLSCCSISSSSFFFIRLFLYFQTNSGVQSSYTQIPFNFTAMHVDADSAYSGWKPFETYQVPREGGTAYPSYDPGARISFKENSFRETCNVSLRVSVAPFSLLFTINNLHTSIAQVNDFKKTFEIPKR